jgi:hypothetical protein
MEVMNFLKIDLRNFMNLQNSRSKCMLPLLGSFFSTTKNVKFRYELSYLNTILI